MKNKRQFFSQELGKLNSLFDLFTASDDDLRIVEVEYKTLPGWRESTEHARKFSDLPANAQHYIRTIESYIGVPGIILCIELFLLSKCT